MRKVVFGHKPMCQFENLIMREYSGLEDGRYKMEVEDKT